MQRTKIRLTPAGQGADCQEDCRVPDAVQTVSMTSVVGTDVPAVSIDDRPVLMILGGGLENGGGIGRMVGYVAAAWNDGSRRPMKVIDTRGPKYRRSVWPFYFLSSIFQIVLASPQRPICHIHLAANSSTLRKVIITLVVR